jgi:NAD(P)H-hydrate epimerase
MELLTPEGMRHADRRSVELGASVSSLMEAAGRAVAAETRRLFPDPEVEVVALCGKGHNGGDGLVAARELLPRCRRVRVLLAGEPADLRGEPARMAAAWTSAGGAIEPVGSGAELVRALDRRPVVLDALLGTGTRGPITGLHEELLRALAGSGAPVVAVDAPSGLDLGTGRTVGPAPRARLTVTFGRAKVGHVLGEGPDHVGRLVVADIGLLPAALAEAAGREDTAVALEPEEFERLLPLPRRRAHKRSAGVVAVVAGSRAYGGAAVLACRGALRAGAGLVHAVVPDELRRPLLASHPEAIAAGIPAGPSGGLEADALPAIEAALAAARPDAVVVGPGLGAAPATVGLVRELAGRWPGGAAWLVDADGLNAFAGAADEFRRAAAAARVAVTPHPGELARLLGGSASDLDADRLPAVRRAADALGAAVLLKGVPTVICTPGRPALLNLTGNAALARGGTGDLLSGVAGAFLAKGMEPRDALALAAFAHGLGADVARASRGTLAVSAEDLARGLAAALRALERGETRSLMRRVGSAPVLLAGTPIRVAGPAAAEPVRIA